MKQCLFFLVLGVICFFFVRRENGGVKMRKKARFVATGLRLARAQRGISGADLDSQAMEHARITLPHPAKRRSRSSSRPGLLGHAN